MSFGAYNALSIGTRLFLTLPTGQRVGFTFTPVKHTLVGAASYYTPAWVPDAGVTWSLESADAKLTLGPRLLPAQRESKFGPEAPAIPTNGYKYPQTANIW